HAGAVVGNTLYVMGGFSNESAAPWLASVESYQSSPADVQPPESQALASPEANYAGWNASPVSMAIHATDEGSGVASLRVAVSGPQPRMIDGPGSDASFVLSADGVHTIRFQATDAAGNIETEKVHVVRIDQRAPEASAAGTPAPNAQGWNTGPVVVRVTSSDDDDGSGVAYLEYTAMGPKRASAPLAAQGLRSPGPSAEVTMVAQGVSTMTYRAVDAAGNASPWATLPVRIDSIAPAIAASASPPPNADAWNRGPVTIALSATDAVPGSGIARIQYSVTSDTFASVAEEPGSSASVTVAREGTSRVDYRAYDVAGHVSADGSLTVRIDATPPTGTLVATPSSIWPPNRQLVPIALDLQVADSGGGPVRVSGPTVTATGGSAAAGDWVVRDGQVWLRAVRDGGAIGRIYTITYVATDLAGNSAPIATTVRVAHEARQ
ncbi:MAG TPA: hypothetical protein VFK48_09345, partial [Usitatibacter sp.]|nr:hypothetical protein [Usitatibacter sp.]